MQNITPSAATDDSSGRRACDQCRVRKIRCDKDWPCSNCRTAKRSCSSTGAGQRPKEPRQRVLISSQYERKIDQIEARLGNIEALLKSIASSQPLTGAHDARLSHTPQTINSSIPTAASIAEYDSTDEEAGAGGDSGLNVHSAFASEFLERAVKKTSLHSVNPKMEAALANLSQIIEMQKHRSISHGPRFPMQRPVPPEGVTKLPMPPIATVVGLLKHVKASPPTLFTIISALVGVWDFSNLCRTVYFATEEFSDATFAVVNGLLYTLFAEQHSVATDQAVRDEYNSYVQLCQANLETILANLPLFLSAKTENVQALLLGALYAIDVSRPSVGWHLVNMAAELCQTGGYHRVETALNDPPETTRLKRILFWHVYTLDKGLGLRLGRASIIPECDISIPREFEFNGFTEPEVSCIPTLWVEISHLQSRIYEQLYSPAALASPQADLVHRAQMLAAECRSLEAKGNEMRTKVYAYLKSQNTSDGVYVFIRGDEVQFQVTMTLVYRVIPAPEGSPTRFCSECLDAARNAMSTHQACARLMNLETYSKSMYVHWNLLLTPFAPFFVLFCYVIETSSPVDLKILQDFVTSLDEATDSSESIEKLYRLCSIMCDIAVLYVEAKSEEQGGHNAPPMGDEFEMFLTQLGFMPNEDQTMAHANDTGMPMQNNGQIAQIADWFSGSRNMIGLLEEDLSQMESYRWMQQP